MELNYKPNSVYSLIIEKPTPHHARYYVYEEDEPEPVISKGFNTASKACDWVKENFPGFKIMVHR